ncbi:MAG TPA: MBL fold metallo-hydrolase [Vicinamibacterales bacterium]|nr:MBL fold metallo-hydrolase [Vicinamibacterales bacterium]
MKHIHSVVAIVVLVTIGCSRTRDAATLVADAQKAIGNPTSIQYTGAGMNAFFGQALTAGQEWPRRDVTAYTRAIDYDTRASREEMTFAQAVFGGQQQNAQIAGDKAWNVGANGPVPQPAAAEERQLMIWLTPHGFLRGAASSGNATLTPGNDGSNTVGFTALGKYRVDGAIDANNLVTRVGTTIANPVLGDTSVVATYSDYKDYGGVKFPSKIAVEEGGFPLWELNVTSVTPNASLDLPVPAAVASAATPPVSVVSTKLGPGVWHLTGGSHHSAVVEFADYTAVVEAPLNEERSLAVLAEARKLAPGKPVRYILTTHHHFDHTGGLRTYAAEGATIVTHQSNVPYFTRTLVAPAAISPDAQTRAQKTPTFQGVTDTYELTDGRQKIQVYATNGDAHTNEYTLIYLPGPKVLIEADAYSPGPADAPPPPVPPANAVKLFDEVQRLKLNVDTIAPVHGRGAVSMAELRKFIGKA